MFASQNSPEEPSNIAEFCGRCLNDAGYRCGMSGAARCLHIETAFGGRRPDNWSATVAGSWSCSDFEADLLLDEPLH